MHEVVVIGTSWGGLHALRTVLAMLPSGFRLPVVVVQHRHKQSEQGLLPQLLQDVAALPVCDVEDKAPIAASNVYVAPADYHLLLERGHFVLSVDEPVAFSRPSIDLTLSSAADAYGASAVGIVLTGSSADGAIGLRRLAERGGLAIVQRPDTAESPVMPAAALAAVPTARVLDLDGIGALLRSLDAETGAVHVAAR